MALISEPVVVDTLTLAKRVNHWLQEKGFETKAVELGGTYAIKARKSSLIRSVAGADRALEVSIRQFNGQTQVDVRQGSWKTNVVSNSVWLVATGGANLALTGWSLIVQKDLESFVRLAISELGGGKEVFLTPTGKALPKERTPTPKEMSPILKGVLVLMAVGLFANILVQALARSDYSAPSQAYAAEPSHVIRAAAPAYAASGVGVCDTPPNGLFSDGAILDDAALADILDKHCRGATPTPKGDYELMWNGQTFLIELKASAGSHKVEGVWLK